ncbi:MAG: LysE family translocator, partial [Bacteroidales bacterium]|nr:LysE family translocator [Bacteroidales bacterium]
MIETIYKGFIIGIIVSAPMGPIGILCVQRTLNRGRLHG